MSVTPPPVPCPYPVPSTQSAPPPLQPQISHSISPSQPLPLLSLDPPRLVSFAGGGSLRPLTPSSSPSRLLSAVDTTAVAGWRWPRADPAVVAAAAGGSLHPPLSPPSRGRSGGGGSISGSCGWIWWRWRRPRADPVAALPPPPLASLSRQIRR